MFRSYGAFGNDDLDLLYRYFTSKELSETPGKSTDSDSLTSSEAITNEDLIMCYLVGWKNKSAYPFYSSSLFIGIHSYL